MPALQPVRILLAEDNPADVRLTQEALRDSKVRSELFVVPNGVEAMAFLRKQGKYADLPSPSLLILDLNMPLKDGRQVLAEVKEDPALRRLPVVVLTSSAHDEDVQTAYDRHANCYVRKPHDFQVFHDVARAIEEFWFTIVELPPANPAWGGPKGGA